MDRGMLPNTIVKGREGMEISYCVYHGSFNLLRIASTLFSFAFFLSFFKVVMEGKLSSSFYFFKGEGK